MFGEWGTRGSAPGGVCRRRQNKTEERIMKVFLGGGGGGEGYGGRIKKPIDARAVGVERPHAKGRTGSTHSCSISASALVLGYRIRARGSDDVRGSKMKVKRKLQCASQHVVCASHTVLVELYLHS